MTFSCREKTSRWVLHVHSVLQNDGRLIGTCCCCSLCLSRQNSKGTTFCLNVRNCGYSARNKGGIVLNVWNIAFFSFTIPRESVLDEVFLLLVMFFFACLFVFEDWQTYTDGWSRTRIGRIQKVTMLVFLSCFFFFCFVFFIFVFRASTNTSTFGLVFAQPALEFIPFLWACANTDMFYLMLTILFVSADLFTWISDSAWTWLHWKDENVFLSMSTWRAYSMVEKMAPLKRPWSKRPKRPVSPVALITCLTSHSCLTGMEW